MEEREALKSQIELLQNLINKHKSIHGDKPFTGTEARPSGSSTPGPGHIPASHPHSSRRGAYAFQSGVSWTKTYSLKNKTPSASTPSSSSAHHQPVSHNVSLPSHSRGKESGGSQTASSSSGIVQHVKDGQTKTTVPGAAAAANKSVMSQPDVQQKQIAESRHAVQQGNEGLASLIKASTSTSSQSYPQVKIKPSLSIKTSSVKQSYSISAKAPGPAPSALSIASTQPPFAPSTQSRQTPMSTSFLKKSKFTWIKTQNMTGGNLITSRTTSVPSVSVSKATGSPSLLTPSKKASAKKSLRKLVPVSVTPKTSKYKWVSSAGTQLKTTRKSPSPKTLTPPQRAGEKGDATKKSKLTTAASPRLKKGCSGSSASASPGSRYRWKAGGVGESVGVTGGPTGIRRRSSFHWTADRNSKVFRGGLFVTPGASPQASVPSSSPSAFKLRSRMKIIRKSSNSHGGGGAEKGAAPSAARFSPRARVHTVPRRPAGVRRTPSRELVAFGKHKLRRLSPTSLRTNPTTTLSHPSSAFQRVFTSRYKMVTRPGSTSTYAHNYNPALSWRAKKIQSARSFLQRRSRAPYNMHLSFAQPWRGTQMCWIDNSLYSVSANRLSRTAPASLSINRTGRSPSFQHSHLSPVSPRTSSTRNLASRAVQRSLAIIRSARQKKQPRQYCMYYNRFGKCNRGTSCPYIHDRDKVAVCTRFLRGTCKQADTCPFSHKVAKEKMPVCSYFLKGICNNSDCPYSHVYVSRKAEVCEDFVKGYCPEGEKCKKKHTLVCPDFSKSGSCPRGSRCKLQHRQRVKRSSSSSSSSSSAPAAKKARREPVERPHLSVMIPEDSQAAQGTPKKSSLALPSYISLSSSPEEADAPDTQRVKEKKLQIKPRL